MFFFCCQPSKLHPFLHGKKALAGFLRLCFISFCRPFSLVAETASTTNKLGCLVVVVGSILSNGTAQDLYCCASRASLISRIGIQWRNHNRFGIYSAQQKNKLLETDASFFIWNEKFDFCGVIVDWDNFFYWIWFAFNWIWIWIGNLRGNLFKSLMKSEIGLNKAETRILWINNNCLWIAWKPIKNIFQKGIYNIKKITSEVEIDKATNSEIVSKNI